jgi:thiamine-phosphate pyrophosphorylase
MTPPLADAAAFAAPLAAALAAGDVAAVVLRLADGDERTLINRIKALAPIAQKQSAALLVDGYPELVARAGADGAHVSGPDDIADALESLKPDWIVGAGGLASRHDAMTAAEGGADYVMFGEPDARGERPSFDAILERISWWAEVFEAPCVAYAAKIDDVAALVAAGADFVALGQGFDDWVWRDPAAAIAAVMPHLQLTESAA